MAIIAAWWGVWHIVSGLTLAAFWSRRPSPSPSGGGAQPPEAADGAVA